MLRLATILGALMGIVIGLEGMLRHQPALDPLLWIGAMVLLAVLLERWRYTREAKPEDGPWTLTDERFEDPATGKIMTVLCNRNTGERRYVPER